MIATLCEHLDTLDEPDAKASMVWIIGEYAERIDNADELLEFFLETFPEEAAVVQMQLVTAAVKLFLKKPTERPQQMIQLVLTYATQVCLLQRRRSVQTLGLLWLTQKRGGALLGLGAPSIAELSPACLFSL